MVNIEAYLPYTDKLSHAFEAVQVIVHDSSVAHVKITFLQLLVSLQANEHEASSTHVKVVLAHDELESQVNDELLPCHAKETINKQLMIGFMIYN